MELTEIIGRLIDISRYYQIHPDYYFALLEAIEVLEELKENEK